MEKEKNLWSLLLFPNGRAIQTWPGSYISFKLDHVHTFHFGDAFKNHKLISLYLVSDYGKASDRHVSEWIERPNA